MSDASDMTFSVIVVSRGRPEWLARCLMGLRQLDHPEFEIIVVADSVSLQRVDCAGMKTVPFDTPNISAARNAGIGVAAGEICAFVDDDAVPEPLWLSHHEAALRETVADASVGFVRGRNGISYQSRLAFVDNEAETHQADIKGIDPVVPIPPDGQAVKLVGTNMAIRRSVLFALGGFDPALRFFLDDTDVSLRLAKAGYKVAVAALAEVHHGFAPSERRTALRAPVDLFDIGRSSAIYFRRHGAVDMAELWARIERRERARLLRHMVQGTCEPRDVARVLKTLKAGWEDGFAAELPTLNVVDSQTEFARYQPLRPGAHQIVATRLLRRRQGIRIAEGLARGGQRASVFSFSLTPVRHHVRYTAGGVWLQTGGQFGRTCRNGPLFKWCRFASRQKEETDRVAKIRGI